MKISEDTIIIYEVVDSNNETIAEFDTRKEANKYIDDRDDHGFMTLLWSVIAIPHYIGD